MEGIINPETVALIQSKLQQGAAKLTKMPETIPADFDQQKMYADEAAHRRKRSERKKKKKK